MHKKVLENIPGAMMEVDSSRLTFDFEPYLKDKLGISLEDDRRELCKYFLKTSCPKGDNCKFRHALAKVEKAVVCKHWLRGLCKKGETCEFLHEYNLKKMPECWFFSKYGECSNSECQYLHVDPDSKFKECSWYARGFCKHGQTCRNKHVRKVACHLYLTGFCPFGKSCENVHPKFDIPLVRDEEPRGESRSVQAENVICYKCGKKGHFSNQCTNPTKLQNQPKA